MMSICAKHEFYEFFGAFSLGEYPGLFWAESAWLINFCPSTGIYLSRYHALYASEF